MKRHPISAIIAIVIGLVLVCGVVACTTRSPGQQEQTEFVETEDCDAEDWRNYDPECGRISPKPAASKASPKVVVPSRAPAPRRSR